MKRLYLSDLHLEASNAPQFERWTELMADAVERVDEIVILGDLVEMWIGDDDPGEDAAALRACLSQTTQTTPVSLLPGNRDFLFGNAFAEQTGVHLLEDPSLTTDGIMLAHGDALCTDDAEYQQVRSLLRSPAWQQDILGKSIEERQALGAMMRAQSRSANANKAANIMDVNQQEVETLLSKSPAQVLIHGHTHRPGIHHYQNGKRIVLGSWERCAWICWQTDSVFELECFSLARRYGT